MPETLTYVVELPEVDNSLIFTREETVLSRVELQNVRIQNMGVDLVADEVVGILGGSLIGANQLLHREIYTEYH